ncbi:MAG: esterase [Planctomycetes bacterium]|nr:esterase [Planctomycetota bacterium]
MRALLSSFFLCSLSTLSLAQAPRLLEQSWVVDEVERTAWVRVPELKGDSKAPLVFAWHGHGGSSRASSRSFKTHEHWPEAIVVYPQGLKTPGFYDPEGKRSGWETKAKAEENRDLKFFDVMLADFLERGIVDERRIHSTGHSNGGGFTYTLLFERGEVFASVAPSSAGTGRFFREKAKVHIPILHLAGEKDKVVPMEWQEPVIQAILKHNECGEPEGWADHPLCKIYPSKLDAPLVTYVHPGGHKMPKDAGELFARFFKEHPKPEPGPSAEDTGGAAEESEG